MVPTGPEAIHADMTSGHIGAVRGLGTDVQNALDLVAVAIDFIVMAEGKPNWSSPDAATRFNVRAWATRASSDACLVRLNRLELALEHAACSYQVMEQNADAQISYYRQTKPQVTDVFGMVLLLMQTISNLAAIRTDYTEALDKARDFVETDPFSDEESRWLANGLIRSMISDVEKGRLPGIPIPDSRTTGDDDGRYAAQGLGYDPETGNLLQTSYNSDGEAVLSIIDPDTGQVLNTVSLGKFRDPDDSDGVEKPPNHAGGVSVRDGVVYVSSSDAPPRLFAYSMQDLMGATPISTVSPLGAPQEVMAGAFSTIDGDTLYVGTHEDGRDGTLYTYTWDPDTQQWGNRSAGVPIPERAQGMAVRGDTVIFSASLGRHNAGELVRHNLADLLSGIRGGGIALATPNMGEGVVMMPEGIITTFESGSASYSDPRDHDPGDLWAATNMGITPYRDLGLDGLEGTIEIETETLREASSDFARAEATLDRAEIRLRGLTLPPRTLGRVPGAAGFATAVDLHLSTTQTWLGESRISAGQTADGLVDTALDHSRTDALLEAVFKGLLR